MRKLLSFLLMILLGVPAVYAESKKTDANIKLGLNRSVLNMTYGYATQKFETASSEAADVDVTATNTGVYTSTDLMFEWILFKVVGLEMDIGLK